MLSTNKSLSSKQDRDNFKIYTIIAAAGLSQRFDSNYLKQFHSFDSCSPIKKSVELFLSIDDINGVICVIPDGYNEEYLKIFENTNYVRLLPPVIGGNSRKESVRNGLNALVDYQPDFVLIHDAARPYCDSSIIENIISNLKNGKNAVVPAVSSVDSVRIKGKSVNRNEVKLIQTPQGFNFDMILNLHNKYRDFITSDDASLCDLEGIDVNLVEGNINNKKITYKTDLEVCFKTGFGYDAHKFSENPLASLCLWDVKFRVLQGLKEFLMLMLGFIAW